MTAFYNEVDPYAAQWLRNLIAAGHIAPGVVDERDIRDVRADELAGFHQCHFFAGIGGWSLALRLAGWPDDRPVWTGSCPCQSFSVAGKQAGFADERHLWPTWFNLIRECRPPVVFGEQVASASVVGASTTPVQDVFGREALFGILRKLKGTPATSVQGMRPICGTCEEESEAYESEGIFQGMETHQERLRACQCREEQSEDTRSSVRSGPEGHTRENRRRDLRGYWSPLRSDEAEIVERSFIGPDSPGGRVHKREYTSRSLLAECHGEYLGGANNNRCCECDKGDKEAEIERIFSEIRGEIEGQSGGTWLDLVSADMEGEDYALGAAVLGAHGVGAPNIRLRLYFGAQRLADADSRERDGFSELRGPERDGENAGRPQGGGELGACGDVRRLADAAEPRWNGGKRRFRGEDRRSAPEPGRLCDAGGLADADSGGSQARRETSEAARHGYSAFANGGACRPDPLGGFWREADWLFCRDGKWRPVEPGTFPMVARLSPGMGSVRAGEDSPFRVVTDPKTGKSVGQEPWRIGMLRGYGNAIVPQVAAAFIRGIME